MIIESREAPNRITTLTRYTKVKYPEQSKVVFPTRLYNLINTLTGRVFYK